MSVTLTVLLVQCVAAQFPTATVWEFQFTDVRSHGGLDAVQLAEVYLFGPSGDNLTVVTASNPGGDQILNPGQTASKAVDGVLENRWLVLRQRDAPADSVRGGIGGLVPLRRSQEHGEARPDKLALRLSRWLRQLRAAERGVWRDGARPSTGAGCVLRGLPYLHATLATLTTSAFSFSSSFSTTRGPNQPGTAVEPQHATSAGDRSVTATVGPNARCALSTAAPNRRPEQKREQSVVAERWRAGGSGGGQPRWCGADPNVGAFLPTPPEVTYRDGGRRRRHAARGRERRARTTNLNSLNSVRICVQGSNILGHG